MVFQILLSKVRDAVPVWRDYMLDWGQADERMNRRDAQTRRIA